MCVGCILGYFGAGSKLNYDKKVNFLKMYGPTKTFFIKSMQQCIEFSQLRNHTTCTGPNSLKLECILCRESKVMQCEQGILLICDRNDDFRVYGKFSCIAIF